MEKYLKAKDRQLYYFTRFIYYGFLRPQELVKLQVKHVDLPNKVITVPSAVRKNCKQQSVTITASLAKAIEPMKLQKVNPEWKLFSKDLLPGPVEIFRNRVSERHRRALDAIDIKKLQSHLRHHSLEMTDIYLKSLGLVIDKELENKEW